MTEFPLDIVTPDGEIFSGRLKACGCAPSRAISASVPATPIMSRRWAWPRRGHHRWE